MDLLHYYISFAAIFLVVPIESANILAITFVPSVSHQEVYQPIWRELSLRGHNVTVMTTNVLADPSLVNLTQIDVSFVYKYMNVPLKSFRDATILQNIFFIDFFFSKLLQAEIAHEDVQKLLQRDDDEFDLVVLEALHPLVYGFAAKFKAPVVAISTLEPFIPFHDALGNPTHPVLRPDNFIHFYGEPTLKDRMTSFLHNIFYRAIYYWRLLPEADKVARKFFGRNIPYLGDVIGNTSLMLINSNPILNTPVANVPSVISFGNVHIKEAKPLPKDIQKFLDASSRGVVYFSLGSNVKSTSLGTEMRDIITQALSELPFNVIWKWEEDELPGKPDNVLLKKWLPQQDILRHPNVKVFVTQGGLQSIEQSIAFGVPMVGIPIYGDQPTNVKTLVDGGMALFIDFKSITKDELKKAILEVGTNIKYRERVVKARELIQDQPMNGLDKAVWWIEHVIRHKGARHLRSPAADMPIFQYFMVDVIAILLFGLYLSVKLTKLIIRWTVRGLTIGFEVFKKFLNNKLLASKQKAS
ncbi:UDP-glycosyltransferase UGT5 [Leptinotarsa decemlineata]|uniref:UDP-glycosyltransferase UGT5 n=1 Tax=Leptinotarsa decemlineata TaxID=7539 RepID=UPI003D3073A0